MLAEGELEALCFSRSNAEGVLLALTTGEGEGVSEADSVATSEGDGKGLGVVGMGEGVVSEDWPWLSEVVVVAAWGLPTPKIK